MLDSKHLCLHDVPKLIKFYSQDFRTPLLAEPQRTAMVQTPASQPYHRPLPGPRTIQAPLSPTR